MIIIWIIYFGKHGAAGDYINAENQFQNTKNK